MPILPFGWADQKATKLKRRFSAGIDRPHFGSLPVTTDRLKVHTILVAADGSGDTNNLQEGIDMLPSGGGAVFVKAGTYTIASTISLVSNLVLTGAGKATELSFGSNGGLRAVSDTDIIISELWLHGNDSGIGIRADANSSNLLINRCWIDNLDNGCVFESTSASSSVTDCRIWNSNVFGISVKFNSIIADNWVSDNRFSGILTNGADNCVITGNHVYNNGLAHQASYDDGIQILSGSYLVVANNRVWGNYSHDINLYNILTTYCLVHGNNCRSSLGAGSINDDGANNQLAHNITE